MLTYFPNSFADRLISKFLVKHRRNIAPASQYLTGERFTGPRASWGCSVKYSVWTLHAVDWCRAVSPLTLAAKHRQSDAVLW